MSSSTILSHIILDLNCLEAGGERHDDYCEAYDYVVECVLLNCASVEEMYNLLEQFDAYSEDYDGDREGYAQAIRDCEYVINSARDDWEEVQTPPAQKVHRTTHSNSTTTQMNNQLLSVREQIQQDILSFASEVDDEKIFFTDEVLDELCDIVVRNFEKLN